MLKTNSEPWISMPYSEFLELFEMSNKVNQIMKENKRLREQVLSLRLIQQECLEKIREIDRYL